MEAAAGVRVSGTPRRHPAVTVEPSRVDRLNRDLHTGSSARQLTSGDVWHSGGRCSYGMTDEL